VLHIVVPHTFLIVPFATDSSYVVGQASDEELTPEVVASLGSVAQVSEQVTGWVSSIEVGASWGRSCGRTHGRPQVSARAGCGALAGWVVGDDVGLVRVGRGLDAGVVQGSQEGCWAPWSPKSNVSCCELHICLSILVQWIWRI
jgi:hypothetical protein